MSTIRYPTTTPNISSWEYRANTAQFSSPTSGTVQTVARPGGRWACSLTYNALSGTDRAQVQAFLAAADGQAQRFYVTDHSYTKRGSVVASELITNGAFASGVTGWTSTSPSDVTIAATSNGARLKRVTATAASVYPAAITTVSGVTYALVGEYSSIYIAGSAETVDIRAGTSAGATALLQSSSALTSGRLVAAFTASGTSTYVGFGLTGTASAGSIWELHSLSCARCFLVAGASQTGSVLAVDQLPVSSTGVLLAGDFVEINGELKMLTSDLDSDSGGAGRLAFKPSLRSAPADNTPVVILKPSMRSIMADNSGGWTSRPGVLSDFMLELQEVIE